MKEENKKGNKKELLTIVDMQNDFMLGKGALPVPSAEKIIRPTYEFVERYGRGFEHVIITFDTHNPEEYAKSEEGKMFPIHCVKGTPGWKLAFPITCPYHRLEKKVFDMWENPPIMSDVPPADFHAVVIGVAADFCVKYAVDGYLRRGYGVTVIHDLTAGIERDFQTVAKNEFQKYLDAGKLRLISAAEYVNTNNR